jgi:branched-chain amino acid transport system substrate-binding protein
LSARRAAVLSVAIFLVGVAAPQPVFSSLPTGSEVILGLQCDRTGSTRVLGLSFCGGFRDYVDLANSTGGIESHRIRVIEIDHEYKVPLAIEAYERHKKEGAVTVAVYGTPQLYALAAKLTADRIPGTSAGFGNAAAADGSRYPYIFPLAATSWSQGAAAADFAKRQLGGSLRNKKIAYIFFDNPVGREPISLFEDLSRIEGFQFKSFAVPPPGIEMGAQALDIAQRYRADFVISHLFGNGASVSITEFKRVGYPLRKVVSFSWSGAEPYIEGAGGFAAAEGYYTIQFAGVGGDFPVLNEIREMYRRGGQSAPKEMASTVFYNRGVLVAAIHVEALRKAMKAKSGGRITGPDVKAGFEGIKGFTLGGLAPPLEITATDHEGGGWVQIWQVMGGKFERVTEWFKAYRNVVSRHVQAAAAGR